MKLVPSNIRLEDYKKRRSGFLKELIAVTTNVSVRAKEFRRWIDENSLRAAGLVFVLSAHDESPTLTERLNRVTRIVASRNRHATWCIVLDLWRSDLIMAPAYKTAYPRRENLHAVARRCPQPRCLRRKNLRARCRRE
jgi:hypothetical protein